eukprot:4391242-Amphidinium_carterae.1
MEGEARVLLGNRKDCWPSETEGRAPTIRSPEMLEPFSSHTLLRSGQRCFTRALVCGCARRSTGLQSASG